MRMARPRCHKQEVCNEYNLILIKQKISRKQRIRKFWNKESHLLRSQTNIFKKIECYQKKKTNIPKDYGCIK